MPTRERAARLAPAPVPPPEGLDEWRVQRSRFVLGNLEMTRERAPCTDCPHAPRCMTERLACEQIKTFVRLPRRERWVHACRQPTREIRNEIAEWLIRQIKAESLSRAPP
jgi:hypothetical protein